MAFDTVKGLMPPKTNDLDTQQSWRWKVFVSVVLLWVIVSGQIALSYGWAPAVHPGFALASDTQAIQKRVDVIASISIQEEIRRKLYLMCNEHNPVTRNELGNDIDRLNKEYKEITHDWYPIPRCDQI